MSTTPEPAPAIANRRLHDCTLLRIDRVVASPRSEQPTEERAMERHAVVLPYRGVFATHAGRRVPVLASSNHAVLLSAGIPYRYSYPAAIGDHCLVLSWPVEASDLAGWRATP